MGKESKVFEHCSSSRFWLALCILLLDDIQSLAGILVGQLVDDPLLNARLSLVTWLPTLCPTDVWPFIIIYLYLSLMLHVWYVYLHYWDIFGVCSFQLWSICDDL